MTSPKKILIFLVDDDMLFLKSLEIEFQEHGDFNIESFATGESCIAALSHNPDVIILDYYLDEIHKVAMNGLETLCRIKEINNKIPVVMLSAQDSIDVAISCMHNQAFDYVVKSTTAFLRLKKIITNIFYYQKIEKALNWYKDKLS